MTVNGGLITACDTGNCIINQSSTLTIQGNAQIKSTSSSEPAIINRYDNASLCINGGTIDAVHTAVHNSAELSITGGTITSTEHKAVRNYSTATIDDGIITAYNLAVENTPNSTLTINGGTYSSTNAKTVLNEGTLTINNGTFSANNKTTIDNSSSGSVMVYDGVFSSKNALVINNAGSFEIHDGEYSNSSSSSSSIINNNAGATINISGGTFTSNGKRQALYNIGTAYISGSPVFTSTNTSPDRATIQNAANDTSSGNMTISSGTINAISYQAVVNGSGCTLTITGGTIKTTKSGKQGIENKGTLVIGSPDDGIVNVESPKIIGMSNGITTASGTVTFHDGLILGKSNSAFDNNNNVTVTQTGYRIGTGTATESGSQYNSAFLEQIP